METDSDVSTKPQFLDLSDAPRDEVALLKCFQNTSTLPPVTGPPPPCIQMPSLPNSCPLPPPSSSSHQIYSGGRLSPEGIEVGPAQTISSFTVDGSPDTVPPGVSISMLPSMQGVPISMPPMMPAAVAGYTGTANSFPFSPQMVVNHGGYPAPAAALFPHVPFYPHLGYHPSAHPHSHAFQMRPQFTSTIDEASTVAPGDSSEQLQWRHRFRRCDTKPMTAQIATGSPLVSMNSTNPQSYQPNYYYHQHYHMVPNDAGMIHGYVPHTDPSLTAPMPVLTRPPFPPHLQDFGQPLEPSRNASFEPYGQDSTDCSTASLCSSADLQLLQQHQQQQHLHHNLQQQQERVDPTVVEQPESVSISTQVTSVDLHPQSCITTSADNTAASVASSSSLSFSSTVLDTSSNINVPSPSSPQLCFNLSEPLHQTAAVRMPLASSSIPLSSSKVVTSSSLPLTSSMAMTSSIPLTSSMSAPSVAVSGHVRLACANIVDSTTTPAVRMPAAALSGYSPEAMTHVQFLGEDTLSPTPGDGGVSRRHLVVSESSQSLSGLGISNDGLSYDSVNSRSHVQPLSSISVSSSYSTNVSSPASSSLSTLSTASASLSPSSSTPLPVPSSSFLSNYSTTTSAVTCSLHVTSSSASSTSTLVSTMNFCSISSGSHYSESVSPSAVPPVSARSSAVSASVSTSYPAPAVSVSASSPISTTPVSPVTSVPSTDSAPRRVSTAPTTAIANKSWASLFRSSASATSTASAASDSSPEMSSSSAAATAQIKADCSDSSALKRMLAGFEPCFRPLCFRARGITNTSNWCYVNSILQALLACAPFCQLMKSLPLTEPSLAGEKSSTPIIDAMTRLVKEFCVSPAPSTPRSGRRDRRSFPAATTPLSVDYVYSILTGTTLQMASGRQEDAEELLTCLLSGLQDEMALVLKPDQETTGEEDEFCSDDQQDCDGDWQTVVGRNRGQVTRLAELPCTPISRIFAGQLRSCLYRSGSNATASVQSFFSLQLDIQSDDVSSVTDALTSLARQESLDGLRCPQSGRHVEAYQQARLEHLPPVLILHLKRFLFDASADSVQKLHKRVDFPVELKLEKDWVSSTCRVKQREYRLFAVVCHSGELSSKGHYICHVWQQHNDQWLQLDDNYVSVVQLSAILQPKPPLVPYILFYQMKHDRSS